MERPRKQKIELAPPGPFFVFCATEDKILYEPSVDNTITRAIATAAAIDHKLAFTSDHQVYIVDKAKPPSH